MESGEGIIRSAAKRDKLGWEVEVEGNPLRPGFLPRKPLSLWRGWLLSQYCLCCNTIFNAMYFILCIDHISGCIVAMAFGLAVGNIAIVIVISRYAVIIARWRGPAIRAAMGKSSVRHHSLPLTTEQRILDTGNISVLRLWFRCTLIYAIFRKGAYQQMLLSSWKHLLALPEF